MWCSQMREAASRVRARWGCLMPRNCGARDDQVRPRRCRAVIEAATTKRGDLREAGELLGVEAIDRTGLVVTSEGAFVRILGVSPVNPLLMSGEERDKVA